MLINLTEIVDLEERWNALTNLSLGQAPINRQVFRSLICDTFRVLSGYDTCISIPKDMVTLFILMSEFSAYSLMSDNEQGFDTIVMSMITTQLLSCFTKGFLNSGSSYPILRMPAGFKVDHINVETHNLLGLRCREECPF